MAMKDPMLSTCSRCGLQSVLCCSACGECASCSIHDQCDHGSVPDSIISGPRNPFDGTCSSCGRTHVLCCRNCGSCACSDHSHC